LFFNIYKAGGTGFKDGPDGYLLIWDTTLNNEGSVLHAFRSRPTVRFGRVQSVVFDKTASYLFAGDTTGSIWVFNLNKEQMIGCINHHTDLVYSLNIYDRYLYSTGHDKKLYKIDISKIDFNL